MYLLVHVIASDITGYLFIWCPCLCAIYLFWPFMIVMMYKSYMYLFNLCWSYFFIVYYYFFIIDNGFFCVRFALYISKLLCVYKKFASYSIICIILKICKIELIVEEICQITGYKWKVMLIDWYMLCTAG